MKMGERVAVTGMLDDAEAADSLGEILVEIVWCGRAGPSACPWRRSGVW